MKNPCALTSYRERYRSYLPATIGPVITKIFNLHLLAKELLSLRPYVETLGHQS